MKARAGLLLGALVATAAAIAPAIPANAALTTSCVGEAGAVTVPGDLVVPAGKSCVLDGTTVEGKVTVRSGADLVVTNGTFKTTVVVQANGYLDLTDTTVVGKITSQGGYGTYTSGSSFAAYNETGAGDLTPFLYAEGATIGGNVTAKAGEVYVSGSTAKNITTTDSSYTDVLNSTLTGNLSVTNAAFGSQVCASEFDGNGIFEGNAGVQLGSGALFGECVGGSNYFGKNVTINNSSVGVEVNGNIIRGNLAGEGNDPAPIGTDNRVRGEQTGQFADLSAAAARSLARRSAPADHGAEIKAKIADRKAEATNEAAAAGRAAIG